jgi:hypothetical protein
LLGLFGGLAAAAGLAATGASPAHALPAVPAPAPAPEPKTDAADIRPEDLDGVATEHTQYWRYRRRYWRPRYRYYRPRFRYYRPRRRYWRRRRYGW